MGLVGQAVTQVQVWLSAKVPLGQFCTHVLEELSAKSPPVQLTAQLPLMPKREGTAGHVFTHSLEIGSANVPKGQPVRQTLFTVSAYRLSGQILRHFLLLNYP